MPTLPADYELKPGQRQDPLVWVQMAPTDDPALGQLRLVDVTDDALQRYMGKGKAMKLKSFGHDDQGVHFLLTRAGTTVHTDPAYARYTHQLVIRNDYNRLRGLPKYDLDPTRHPMLVPGTLYCLDTHSPHQGTEDLRFPAQGRVSAMKAVVAVDRNEPLTPAEAWELLKPWIGRQLSDVDYDPTRYAAPKWKDKTTA